MCARAKSFQSCPTLCNPMDCSPLGSSVDRILQAKMLEWVAMTPPPVDLPDPGIKPVSLMSLERWVLYHSCHLASPIDSIESEKVKVKSLSRVRLFVTPWTVAHQAPPSMGFSRQEYWSGLPFPSPGNLPDPGIEPGSPWVAGRQGCTAGRSLNSEPPRKPNRFY